jgi:hypothetical protein
MHNNKAHAWIVWILSIKNSLVLENITLNLYLKGNLIKILLFLKTLFNTTLSIILFLKTLPFNVRAINAFEWNSEHILALLKYGLTVLHTIFLLIELFSQILLFIFLLDDDLECGAWKWQNCDLCIYIFQTCLLL